MPVAYLFPYEPNWVQGVKYRITYPCKIITSYQGVEQRILLKQIPVLETEARFDLGDSYSSSMFDALVWNSQSIGNLLPIWLYSTTLESDILAGSTTIKIPTTNPYFGSGDTHVALIDIANNNIHEYATITGADATYMYLLNPLTRNWAAHDTFIVPCRPARIPPEVQILKASNAITSSSIIFKYQETPLVTMTKRKFTVGDIDDTALSEVYIGVPLYHGEELCIMESNRLDSINVSYKRNYVELDFNTGIVTILNRQYHSEVTRDFVMFLDGFNDIINFIKWCDRRKGRCVPFWVNSGQNEIQLVNNADTGSTTIRVADSYLEKLFEHTSSNDPNKIHPLRSNIVFFNNNGTSIYTRILAIGTKYSDNTVDLIVEALSAPLLIDKVIMGSFLQHCRLDSDTVEIDFYDKRLASASLKFVEVLYD